MKMKSLKSKVPAVKIFSAMCVLGYLLSCGAVVGNAADGAPGAANSKEALRQTEDAITKLETSIATMKAEIAKIESSSDASVWGTEQAASIKNDLTKDMKAYLPPMEEQLTKLKALRDHLAAGGASPKAG